MMYLDSFRVMSRVGGALLVVILVGCTSGGAKDATDTIAPQAPGSLQASVASATQINLTWTASSDSGGSGLAGYFVYRDGGSTPINAQQVVVTSYSDSGLAASSTHSYVVRAIDGAGNYSAASNTASATTQSSPDVTPPSAPTGLTATAASSSQINLSWIASSDTGGSGIAGYLVFRDGGATAINPQLIAATSYSDTGLAASSTHSYVVRAVDGASNVSSASAQAQATTQAMSQTIGLDSRPSNTSCIAGAPPSSGGTTTSVQLENIYPNLPVFQFPIAMMQAPNNATRWYVVEKAGRIKMFADSPSVASVTTVLDITGRVNVNIADALDERGLLGLAFHPDFANSRRIYVNYVHAAEAAGYRDTSRISEFTLSGDGITFDANSERVILRVHQPADNHNGGNLMFGPDGYLYIGMGDGGDANDDHDLPTPSSDGNAQNLRVLLGKMLRINVNGATGTTPYSIPADNPFAGNALCNAGGISSQSCPEIFAWGLRNPWRWSFDGNTGELWVGDVMQGENEEINVVVRGGNYGWPCKEGNGAFTNNPVPGVCSGLTMIDPIAQTQRGSGGNSVTGGYVYRGPTTGDVNGKYIFADFGSGFIAAVDRTQSPSATINCGSNTAACRTLRAPDYAENISSFAQSPAGELYALRYGAGRVARLAFSQTGGAGGSAIPTSLLATGCVDTNSPTQPASGLIPYAPNAPFWSDGAQKLRWLALPNGQTMSVGADGDFNFPNGAVLMKNFRLANQLIETRLFMKHTDGAWAGYSYEWNDAQTDATLVAASKTRSIAGQSWLFPSGTQCLQCHTAAAGFSLSIETAQLNGDLLYPTGRTANQLTTLNAINVLTTPVVVDASTPKYHDPSGASGTLNERARAYLHSNCSQCHRPGTSVPVNIDLRYSASLAQTNACNVDPSAGALGIPNAKIITPGSASASVLAARINRRDASGMPPLASSIVDAAGVQLINDWINSLTGCQ